MLSAKRSRHFFSNSRRVRSEKPLAPMSAKRSCIAEDDIDVLHRRAVIHFQNTFPCSWAHRDCRRGRVGARDGAVCR